MLVRFGGDPTILRCGKLMASSVSTGKSRSPPSRRGLRWPTSTTASSSLLSPIPALRGAEIRARYIDRMHVLFEDHHLIAVNKPAPLMTQAPAGVPSLEAEVRALIKEKYAKPAGVYLGIPHRLDRPVSGVVVFCRNTKAAQRVAEQFQKHTVTKVYWALVEGVVADEIGEWRDFLRKIEVQAKAEIVPAETQGAKEAVTAFKVLRRDEDATLLELTPKTGRMHQLRVQAAARRYPVLGDTLYGCTRPFGPSAELPRDRVIALHARRLVIEHPFRKVPVELEAPLPEYWGVASGSA
jgi:23S rRNA pseudouridine1911/1915/1917 synthase